MIWILDSVALGADQVKLSGATKFVAFWVGDNKVGKVEQIPS